MSEHRDPRQTAPGSMGRRATQFLGLQRSFVGVLAMAVLIGLGERMAERFVPIYILAVGGGAAVIGLFQGLTNLLSALYSYPGGYLADRIGPKRSLLIFNLITIAGFILVIAIPKWPAVILGSVLFLSWNALSVPATMNVIARVLPTSRRTMGVTMHSLVRRVPKAVGPLVGGTLIARLGETDGVRAAFVVALVLAVAAIFFQQRLIEPDVPIGAASEARAQLRRHPVALLRDMGPTLRGLLVSDILIRFCEQIPYAFVVIWCMKNISNPVSALQFGMLTAIEMSTAVVVYIPVARQADRLGKRPFVLLTFVFFTLFPLTLLFCRSFWPLVAAFVLRGLKEFGEPARKALILDLCPDERRATMFGFYYLVRDVIVSVAALAGAWLWTVGPAVNLLTAFAFGVLGTVWFALRGGDAKATD